MSGIDIKVLCYEGHRGDETPRAIVMEDKVIRLRQIITRWIEEGADGSGRRRCFKAIGEDGLHYTICWYYESAGWRLEKTEIP